MRTCVSIVLINVLVSVHHAFAFTMPARQPSSRAFDRILECREKRDATSEILREEAEKLLAQARAIRSELPPDVGQTAKSREEGVITTRSSPWSVPPSEVEATDGIEYRLYVDIGREPGTWMDPRWGASGRRIEFTVDVRFEPTLVTDSFVRDLMVKDNFGGKSGPVCVLRSADKARLRGGFDQMKCYGGAYRIDQAKGSANTARFYLTVEGTPEQGSPYGDVSIPEGCLYFSIPVFGSSLSQMSTKEGPVTVRQMGWHTGWRREESRIVGTFRAVKMEVARRRDGF
jgi:hypothetical protein